MFPVQLQFYIATAVENCRSEAVQGLFPGLEWGTKADLMKRCDEWPAAVVFVEAIPGAGSYEAGAYPVLVDFAHFPRRIRGEDAVMLPTKLGLLRLLAGLFECRVLCRSHEFCREEEGVPSYARDETFLCQAGRVFAGSVIAHLVRETGASPDDGWRPLDDLPEVILEEDARIRNEAATVAAVAEWVRTRDLPYLDKLSSVPFETDAGSRTDEAGSDFGLPSGFENDAEETKAGSDDLDEYFKRLDQWERGMETTGSKQLIGSGVSLPPPDTLDDVALRAKLWEVIGGLGEKNTFLYRTDHLTDRELYSWLWENGLNEGTMDLSGLSDCGCHMDTIGSGSDEDIRIGLIYYDDAEQRADWKACWPDETIPAHVSPPCDRDRHLPKRNF